MQTTQPISFRQRLLAEAVRLEEDRLGRIIDTPEADTSARAVGGDFERRIIVRASQMPLGRRIAEVIQNLDVLRHTLVLVVPLLGLIAGMLAALAVFGPEATVNIGVALFTLLGLQLLMLMFWVLLLLFSLRGASPARGGMIGRGILVLVQRLGSRWSKHPETGLVLRAGGQLLRRSRLGQWLASTLTHTFWLAFGVGALLATVLLLSFRQYDFFWGTTLLSEESFMALMQLIAAPAQAWGWISMDTELMRASRLGGEVVVSAREYWSGFLLSMLVIYGILPRLVFLLLSGVYAWRSLLQLRLDTRLPGYARLSERLGAFSQSVGVLDPAPATLIISNSPAPQPMPVARQGAILVIGLELERGPEHWPPAVEGVDWIVLGRADDRRQRQDVLAALRAHQETVHVLIVICSLARTPDRGAERYLLELRAHTDAPLWMLLDERQRMQDKGGDPDLRAAQWQAVAQRVGVERVLEVELDAAQHPGLRELQARLG